MSTPAIVRRSRYEIPRLQHWPIAGSFGRDPALGSAEQSLRCPRCEGRSGKWCCWLVRKCAFLLRRLRAWLRNRWRCYRPERITDIRVCRRLLRCNVSRTFSNRRSRHKRETLTENITGSVGFQWKIALRSPLLRPSSVHMYRGELRVFRPCYQQCSPIGQLGCLQLRQLLCLRLRQSLPGQLHHPRLRYRVTTISQYVSIIDSRAFPHSLL